MKSFSLELRGCHFQQAYLIYIIKLKAKNKDYYYVGQTGDSHYKIARPAFLRLAGHLELRQKSTQNQIVKYICKELIKEDLESSNHYDKLKYKILEFLSTCHLGMNVYPVYEISNNISKKEHQDKNRMIKEFEKHIIRLFEKNNKELMNKSKPKPKEDLLDSNLINILSKICKDFNCKRNF